CEPLIIRNVEVEGFEPTALECSDRPSLTGDPTHLLDSFQWFSEMHQECPATYKICPAIFHRNIVSVALAESDLASHSLFLCLLFGCADVGGPNVHSDNGTFSRYEPGEVSGEVSCTASHIHDFHSGLQPEKSGVHLFDPWFGLKKLAIDFPATA